MGKSTISMAIFNSFLYVYQRVSWWQRPHRPCQHQHGLPLVPTVVVNARSRKIASIMSNQLMITYIHYIRYNDILYIQCIYVLLLLLYTFIIYIYYIHLYTVYTLYIYIYRCIFIQYINIHTYKKYGLYFHVYSNPYVILFQPAGRTTTTIILIIVVIVHRASSSSSQPKPFNPLNKSESRITIHNHVVGKLWWYSLLTFGTFEKQGHWS